MTVRNRCASCREPISLLWASWNSGTEDSLYGVISVPLLGCEERFRFGAIRKKETKPSQMEQDFLDLVSTRFKRMEMADID